MNINICRYYSKSDTRGISSLKVNISKVIYCIIFQDFKLLGYNNKPQVKPNKTEEIQIDISNSKSLFLSLKKRKVLTSSYIPEKINWTDIKSNLLRKKTQEDYPNSCKDKNSVESNSSELSSGSNLVNSDFFHTPHFKNSGNTVARIIFKKIKSRITISHDIFQNSLGNVTKVLNFESPQIKLDKSLSFKELIIINYDDIKKIFKLILLKILKNIRFEESTLIYCFVIIDRFCNTADIKLENNNSI